jgi:carboxyl-terminal processing protease
MNKYSLFILSLWLLAVSQSNTQSEFDVISSEPLEVHSAISTRIARIAEGLHYERIDIDNALSSEILDTYLDNLDGSRYYFLVTDISSFARYRFEIDNLTKQGDVSPAFNIFNAYRSRVHDRIQYAINLLDIEMAFEEDETFEFERENSNWPLNQDQADDLWRRRVKNDALSLSLTGQEWDEIKETLTTRYNRILEGSEDVSQDDIFQLYMNSVVRSIDPHSTYFNPRNSEEYEIQMSLSYQGIGATLQLNDDVVTITQISPGGPAYRSGLLNPQDRIVAIKSKENESPIDVIGWDLKEVVQLIRGPIGTSVTLHVLPEGAIVGADPKIITLIRDEIKLEEQAAKKDIIEITDRDLPLKVGVITVPSFYQDFQSRSNGDEEYTSTTRDVQRLVEEFILEGGIDGLVIDLRNNGGGHLSEATALTGLFVDEGPIVQIKKRRGSSSILPDPSRGSIYRGPLVVLVNRYSASASEIFAGALQDYGRAIVVGQQTYGKGTVQNMFDLDQFSTNDDYGQLSLTIAKYYRITGESTQHRGVIPDIHLPSAIDITQVGESSEPSALSWDQISSANFEKDNTIAALIPSLRQNHQQRLYTMPDLIFYNQNIEATQVLRARTEITLNRASREIDREDQDQERLDRYNEWLVSTGETPVNSIDEIAPEAMPDFLLDESVNILTDLIEYRQFNLQADSQRNLEINPSF